jgi:PKD repeat protein
VSFGNANAIDTSATFSSTGTYVVRLTANDGQLSASDDATITVSSSGSGGSTTVEKRIASSADDAEQGASGAVDLNSSDLELVADGSDVQTVGLRFAGLAIPPGAAVSSAWIQFQTDETSSVATTLTIQGEASDNAVPFTSGTNNIGARPRTTASVGWTPAAWNVVGEAGSAQRTPDLAGVVQQIVNRGGWVSGNAMVFVITGSGERTAEAYDGSTSGAPLLHVVFGGAGGNTAPSVSAGPDRSIQLGQSASLDGTVSDDGLPNGTLSTTWSKVSGPGTVAFANASAVDTTATFSLGGNYVLRLSASDGELSGQDEMAVTVNANAAPSVSAGPDRMVSLGQAASLDGTVSDDGLPNGTLTTTWSKVSGPGTVAFGNASAVDTTATFGAAGSYVLRLTASDGELSAQDEMAVSVLDPNAPGVIERRIGVGSDDAEQRIRNGAVDVTGGALEIVVASPGPQLVGLRFQDLQIPAGATIQNAWIQFTTRQVTTNAASITIQGEATANPPSFASTSNNIGARPRSAASVSWSPPGWSVVGASGTAQRTPTLTSLVQEAVNRTGWSPGNAMVFILSGSGTRTAEAFDRLPSGAPLLHVEYGPGS